MAPGDVGQVAGQGPEPDEPRQQARLNLNLDKPLSVLQVALQRAVDHAAFGLTAAGSIQPEQLHQLPGVFPQVAFASKPLLGDELVSAFKAWTVAGAVRDAIEALELFWRNFIFFASPPGSSSSLTNRH